MTDHFIKNIEIRHFKCFNLFKASGFARVNLIGGKNNVGKTALMEACNVNIRGVDVKNFTAALASIKYRRERLNNPSLNNIELTSYLEKTSDLTVTSNIRSSSFKVNSKDGVKKYKISIGDKSVSINVKDFTFEKVFKGNIIFMSSLGATDRALMANYSSLQKNDKEEYLNHFLNKVDSRIESFKVIEDVPQCKVNTRYIEVSDMGDGIRHLINIISSLYSSENGQLFIDEIDNGLHYTILDDVWNIILTLSKELNVQVFATTHSKECIESYERTANKLQDQNITYTILTKLKDGSIDAGVYDAEMLTNTLEQDHELRGW
ncbi:ATP/GTP-binding protein [uncultured Cocleimonas sp.]|uniref:AAA family ATPase n=1 Tax=uncultured Cocleimonas sp. TaxID=1051587 RepID=UPI00262F1634|nr:AAA family ATPase [uncultured Cocleimonas sp.]